MKNPLVARLCSFQTNSTNGRVHLIFSMSHISISVATCSFGQFWKGMVASEWLLLAFHKWNFAVEFKFVCKKRCMLDLVSVFFRCNRRSKLYEELTPSEFFKKVFSSEFSFDWSWIFKISFLSFQLRHTFNGSIAPFPSPWHFHQIARRRTWT